MLLGGKIRRPHWKAGRFLVCIDWEGIPCAVEPSTKGHVNATYNFPREDVIALDWEYEAS